MICATLLIMSMVFMTGGLLRRNEQWDGIFSYPFSVSYAKGSNDAPFLNLWRIFTAHITASTQILLADVSQLGTLLNKVNYWNAPQVFK